MLPGYFEYVNRISGYT